MGIYRKIILWACSGWFALLGGCSLITEKSVECIHRLQVSFYSRTQCQGSPVYPGEIRDLLLCVFDRQGTLVEHNWIGGVALGPDYSQTVEVSGGYYTALAWAGISQEQFEVAALQNGVTRRDEVFLRLRRDGDLAVSLAGTALFFGESAEVYVEPGGTEVRTVSASVNLLELTNRFSVSVSGFRDDPAEYTIRIEADNGSMYLGGGMAPDDVIVYPASYTYAYGLLEGELTTLRLEAGHNYALVVSHSDGTELYRGDLLGELLLQHPEIDLLCDHDFTIRLTIREEADRTYMVTEIWVNEWLVHSYGTDF